MIIITVALMAAGLGLAFLANEAQKLEDLARRMRREYAELSIKVMEDEVSLILGHSLAPSCQTPAACSQSVHNLDPPSKKLGFWAENLGRPKWFSFTW